MRQLLENFCRNSVRLIKNSLKISLIEVAHIEFFIVQYVSHSGCARNFQNSFQRLTVNGIENPYKFYNMDTESDE